MSRPPSWLAALFLLAVGGVLVAVGAVVARAAGVAGLAVYGALVLAAAAGTGLVARRASAARPQQGRTCTCCTGTVHDPVRVI